MMTIYVFGNGNVSFEDFRKYYEEPMLRALETPGVAFVLCDFRGTDVLAMELLKSLSANVKLYHVGERPRYFPDKYKTKAAEWLVNGGFGSDEERDHAAIDDCTHFLAIDFNSDAKRKSGTQRNIERCEAFGKTRL